MDISGFQQARLIPTVGIRGEQEQEGRTTSAFLAILTAVPEYSRVLLKELGAPAGRPQTFVEPEFVLGERKVRPDGLIVIERAGKRWTALVEVKTGHNSLRLDQINDYLDVAKLNNIDALLTISNQVLTLSGEHPVSGIDGRKTKKIRLVHFSWMHILSEALMQKEHRGVSDVDQHWILGEFVRYLQHPASGASEFDDMGAGWTDVLKGISTGTLSPTDPKVHQTVGSFESLTKFLALRLSVKLGVNVKELSSKIAQTEPKKHLQQESQRFVQTGILSGSLRIPNTASDLAFSADLRAKSITSSIDVIAPSEGRNSTKVNWLLRQLKGAPESLRLESKLKKNGSAYSTGVLLSDASANPKLLIPENGNEIYGFRLTMFTKMGVKHGAGQGSFVLSAIEAVELGYQFMLENFKAWTAKAPQLTTSDNTPADSPFDPVGPDGIDLEE